VCLLILLKKKSYILYLIVHICTFALPCHIFKVIRSAVCCRFEDIPEVIDDSLPGPMHDSLSDSFVDQDVILEM
jgi:hypothetical protein